MTDSIMRLQPTPFHSIYINLYHSFPRYGYFPSPFTMFHSSIHSFIHSFIHLLPMISLVSPQKYRVKRLTRAVPMNACFAICSATLLPTACETPISSLFPLYFPLFFLLIIFKQLTNFLR